MAAISQSDITPASGHWPAFLQLLAADQQVRFVRKGVELMIATLLKDASAAFFCCSDFRACVAQVRRQLQDLIADTVVSAPVPWLGGLGNRLTQDIYIRRCYPKLLASLQAYYKKSAKANISVITGTPGTSLLVVYLLKGACSRHAASY